MSKKAKKPGTPRVKCPDCGAEYDAGAPHSAFCPGCSQDEECECGNKGDAKDAYGDEIRVVRCRHCEQVFCSECGNTDERKCYACDNPE